MSDKQTQCPICETIYKVSVNQLTVAHGMVCCPKCSNTFNALSQLLSNASNEPLFETSPESIHHDHQLTLNKSSIPTIDDPITTIFKCKPQNSNVDLLTYLNNLTQFNNNPISTTPLLHLSSGQSDLKKQHSSKKSLLYYLIWTMSNIILLSIFVFQILWFNPQLLEKLPVLNSMFTKTCAIMHCDTAEQRYNQIKIEKLDVNHTKNGDITFSGILLNHYEKSLSLPKIKVKFRKNRVETATFILLPEQYLTQSLNGIKRIPTESPYPFKFSIPYPSDAYDHYHVEVIHP